MSLQESDDLWLTFAFPPRSGICYRGPLRDVAASCLFCECYRGQYAALDNQEIGLVRFVRAARYQPRDQSVGLNRSHGIASAMVVVHHNGGIAIGVCPDVPCSRHRSADIAPANRTRGITTPEQSRADLKTATPVGPRPNARALTAPAAATAQLSAVTP